MPERSRLVSLKVRNVGCIGPDGLEVALDDIVCLVGRNNTGKSTILRAYELAQGSRPLTEQDPCQWTPADDCPEVEIVVHIPDGIPNVASDWKQKEGELRLVRSRWRWAQVGAKPVRQTWDPRANDGSGDWAADGKAGGADSVFNSRLPQPLRVDSLGDAFNEHSELLKLITEPVANELKKLQESPNSALCKAIESVLVAAKEPVAQYQAEIDGIGLKLGKGFKGVFPDLDVRIHVAIATISIDAAKLLASGSSVRVIEGGLDTAIKQQGTGPRRALFWALLQVRNTIVQERRQKQENEKENEKNKKELEKLTKAREKEAGKDKPSADKLKEIDAEIQRLQADAGGDSADIALPGHILLIDEPENALHPMAVRAARDHLYALAGDPNWQVMLSTHSPYFIDPLADHTTILRLERDGERTAPSTFRTATAKFSDDDRADLRALLQLDTALSEMFFGSYPILVEGDTELAAYMAAVVQGGDALATQVTLVPARGKALIPALVRLLTHFRVPFGVLHDTDGPCLNDGKKNGAWKQNQNIADAIIQSRKAGIQVRHRVCTPDFERFLGGFEGAKDKPILAHRKVLGDRDLSDRVKQLFLDLARSETYQPYTGLPADATAEKMEDALVGTVKAWAEENAAGDSRYNFPT